MMFVQGLCLEKLEDWQPVDGKVNVVVTDDLIDKAVKIYEFGKLFTVYSHHKSSRVHLPLPSIVIVIISFF